MDLRLGSRLLTVLFITIWLAACGGIQGLPLGGGQAAEELNEPFGDEESLPGFADVEDALPEVPSAAFPNPESPTAPTQLAGEPSIFSTQPGDGHVIFPPIGTAFEDCEIGTQYGPFPAKVILSNDDVSVEIPGEFEMGCDKQGPYMNLELFEEPDICDGVKPQEGIPFGFKLMVFAEEDWHEALSYVVTVSCPWTPSEVLLPFKNLNRF